MVGRIKNILFFTILFSLVIGIQSCQKETSSPLIPTPPSETSDTYFDCMIQGKDNTLEIATWNIEHFPKSSITTTEVQSIISHSEYDVWGVQEIEDEGALKSIKNLDSRYSVIIDSDIISGVNRNYHLAFVYRNDKLEVLDKKVLGWDSYFFPRKPLLVKFKRKDNNTVFYAMNNHFKAMGGTENENRRTGAAKKIKEFIDSDLPNSKVIVIGDYNDVISPYNESECKVFLDDKANFRFADMELATSKNPREDFSYPGWGRYGSHIDHILITNEIFSSFESVKTLTLDNCSNNYDNNVSDHRPVVAFFNWLYKRWEIYVAFF